MDHTISLDKRLAADGRGLQEVQINEQKAREAVAMRSKVQREELMMLKEKDTLYRPKTDADTHDMYGGADEQLEKVFKTDGFKPDKAFTGAPERPSGNKRERPIEFVTGNRCDIFGYEAVMARLSLKRRWSRMNVLDDDEIGGDGASVLITDRYGSYGLYRI